MKFQKRNQIKSKYLPIELQILLRFLCRFPLSVKSAVTFAIDSIRCLHHHNPCTRFNICVCWPVTHAYNSRFFLFLLSFITHWIVSRAHNTTFFSKKDIHWTSDMDNLNIGRPHAALQRLEKNAKFSARMRKRRTSHLSKMPIKTYTDDWRTPRIPNKIWNGIWCVRCTSLENGQKCKLACEQMAKMVDQNKQSK